MDDHDKKRTERPPTTNGELVAEVEFLTWGVIIHEILLNLVRNCAVEVNHLTFI